MRFPHRYGTGSSGIHNLLEPALEMAQGGDVLEPEVGEGGAVVALRRRDPAERAAESVVVVVVDEDSQRCLRLIEAAEALAVEHLLLEDAPESLDLAVGPGRADLGSQMLDVEVPQALAEAGEHSRHPDHEGEAVVAHQLDWVTAQLEALVEPSQDGRRLGLGQDSEPDHEAGMVVDQAHDPCLDVALAAEVDEERALDVNVPELIGSSPLVAGPRPRWHTAARAAPGLEQAIDVGMANLIDQPPGQFSRDPLRVPVGEQANGDDDSVDPSRDGRAQLQRPSRALDQPLDAALLVASQPAVQRTSRHSQLSTRAPHPGLQRSPHPAHPSPHLIKAIAAPPGAGRPAVLSGQEEEPGAFLVVVPPKPSAGIGRSRFVKLGHASNPAPRVPYLSGNFN